MQKDKNTVKTITKHQYVQCTIKTINPRVTYLLTYLLTTQLVKTTQHAATDVVFGISNTGKPTDHNYFE